MTVGQPETNLDTWGLRYVKKKTATENIEGSTARGERRVGAHSEGSSTAGITTGSTSHLSQTDIDVSSHGGRQNDSSGDTVGRHSASGKKIGEQRHEHKQDKQSLVGQKYQGDFTTTGRHEGATAQIGSDESKRLGRDQTRMTARWSQGQDPKYNTRNQKRRLGVGEGASHESGITSPETRTGKKQQGGDYKPENVKVPRGAKTTREAGDKPKGTVGTVASTGKPATPKTAALDLAIIKCKLLKMNGIIKVDGFKITPKGEIGEKTDKKETPKAQEYTQEEKDKKDRDASLKETKEKYPNMYKSEDIVSKAIELINTAYDEMNKGATIISERSVGRGKPFCSNCGRDHDKEDAKSIAADKEDPTLMVSGTGGGGKPSCPSCGHRPTKKDAPATTSTEGAFNHVYSDVHEKKKQEEMDEDDYRERKRDRARSSTTHENVPE